eukprot:2815640-Pyramimonas_sp.AAC.1
MSSSSSDGSRAAGSRASRSGGLSAEGGVTRRSDARQAKRRARREEERERERRRDDRDRDCDRSDRCDPLQRRVPCHSGRSTSASVSRPGRSGGS